MQNKKVLVVGASGFVGSAAVRRFQAAGGWRIATVSRHRPRCLTGKDEHYPVDLLDPAACKAAAAQWHDVTHVVYAAINETPGSLVASWSDPTHAERNGRMLDNLLDALLPAATGLRHVGVVHGLKAYGVHWPDVRLPILLRESLPRPPHDDFYFRQEDSVWSRRKGAQWNWTVLRASMIAGGGLDNTNLNALLAIAVFACLRKDAGLPLPFTGAGQGLGVLAMTDVDLLARAIEWSATAEGARDQIFNVANGDEFVWSDLLPAIAEEIGLPIGEREPQSLVEAIGAEAPRWAELVRRHKLAAPADWRTFLGESAALADFTLAYCERTLLPSTIKIRQAGFHDCVDTAESVAGWIRRWREESLLPPR